MRLHLRTDLAMYGVTIAEMNDSVLFAVMLTRFHTGQSVLL